ncbi:SAM-dependent methyltransferase [Nakamurella endophytica]|uniref:Methyltransferase n=1 Tax=Nakamurella endophytica TaxID=1748367 RepID=A0A917WMK8_9ACTN|nr:class I SAM-dependent methyltransferase [Nakamurella endophytica]GGM15331.1 methyltransferase [Nakamurella endophytica]
MRRALMIPRVATMGAGVPRDSVRAWERYWSEIESTGDGGQVLWDSADDAERQFYRTLIDRHLEPGLPAVDLGCGNGRFARWLTGWAPKVRGVDVSAAAVELARREASAEGAPESLDWDVLDATDTDAGRRLHRELGDCHVFVRGVFHVLAPAQRRLLAATARLLVGARGRVLLAETNFPGSGLAYLEHLGAGPRHFPSPLERAIRRLPRPGHFGAAELRDALVPADWTVVEEGDVMIRTVPLRTPGVPVQIPGYWAVLAGR